MTMPANEEFWNDPLTGCQNRRSFYHAIRKEFYNDRLVRDISLLFVDINHFKEINNTYGHEHGDSILHWLGKLLTEESNGNTYRMSGEEFAIPMAFGFLTEHEHFLQRILIRIEQEAKSLEGMADPAIHIALIHLKKDTVANPILIHMQMDEAMLHLKRTQSAASRIFMAEELKLTAEAAAQAQGMSIDPNESDDEFGKRWLITHNAHQVRYMEREMERELNSILEIAYRDSVSGLHNIRGALRELEKQLQNETSRNNELSILLMDGDNIRAYNNINYAEGDKLIHDMGVVFKENLRTYDFVARWRTGDEFIVILPETSGEGARVVAERFRLAIKDASQNWIFPTSITIGIATFPTHGNTVSELVDKAEGALKKGKDAGKDQVVLAE